MAEVFNRDGIKLTAAIDDEKNGIIYTLLMDRGENRFNPSLIQDISDAIAIVESSPSPPSSHQQQKQEGEEGNNEILKTKCLIIIGKGKFFSNGLDVNYMSTHTAKESHKMIENVWRLLARILVLDCFTIAAINGHAYGAGLFLALCCDYRIMRNQRGYINFPELNLGMPLAIGFAELSKAKISNTLLLRNAVLFGERHDSTSAKKVGLIDDECTLESLYKNAIALANGWFDKVMKLYNFNPKSYQQMKIELYTNAYDALSNSTISASTPSSFLPSRSRL